METMERVVDKTVEVAGIVKDVVGLASLYLTLRLALRLNKERFVIDYVLDRMGK